MTESDWITATDPQAMLEFLLDHGTLSERKARLFSATCCRRVWRLLRDERCRRAVEAAERYADGVAERVEALHAGTALKEAMIANLLSRSRRSIMGAWLASLAVSLDPIPNVPVRQIPVARAAVCVRICSKAKQTEGLADLLRDVTGNSLAAPPRIDPAWLAWNNGTIPKLAEAAYEHRSLPSGELDHAQLAVLADALEEVGADALLLEHLRCRGPHIRGCFVIDMLTGRE